MVLKMQIQLCQCIIQQNIAQISSNNKTLWFYSKDEANNFDNNIVNTNNFKSFKNKAKLLENTVAQLGPNLRNEILRNATIVVPLKYLSNFWRSLEIPLINCKVELKLEWAKCCFFSVVGNENNIHESTNANDIIFTIKDTNLYVPVVTLSARCNKKLSKLLSKGLKNQNLLDSI